VGRFSLLRLLPAVSSAFVLSLPGPARASARAHARVARLAREARARRHRGARSVARHGLFVFVEPAAAALALLFVKLSVRCCVARALARARASVPFSPLALRMSARPRRRRG